MTEDRIMKANVPPTTAGGNHKGIVVLDVDGVVFRGQLIVQLACRSPA